MTEIMILSKIKKISKYIQSRVLYLLDCIQIKRRQPYIKRQRAMLNNKDFTLLSNNCNGGVLLHELGLRFNSPLVNLNIPAKDYIQYLKRFEYYNSLTLTKCLKIRDIIVPIYIILYLCARFLCACRQEVFFTHD